MRHMDLMFAAGAMEVQVVFNESTANSLGKKFLLNNGQKNAK